MKKRILSLILAVMMLANIGVPVWAEEGEPTASLSATDVTQSQVLERISELKTKLNGKYFTENAKACIADDEDKKCGYHGQCVDYNKDNCLNTKVIGATWFQNLMGIENIPTNIANVPGTAGFYSAAYTCVGFSQYAMWYIFKSNRTDKITATAIYENVPINETNLSKLKPGDVIWANNKHSFVYVSNNSYFDCNGWNANLTQPSIVEFHDVSIKSRYSGSMSVYRANNYDTTGNPTISTEVKFSPETTKYNIGETNAVLSSKITVSGSFSYKDATEIGVYLYDNAGTQIATKSESPYLGYNGYLLSWYDINNELGVTLEPGTTYKFRFFVKIDNQIYYEDMRSFTTTGNASYSVTFNANGGITPTSSKTVTNGSTYGTLPTPTRSGYTFDGWYTAASGGSKVLSATEVNITADRTLYAHWTPILPGRPVLKLEKTSYYTDETITCTWESVTNGDYYEVFVVDNTAEERVIENWGINDTKYTFSLPTAGSYRIYVNAINEDLINTGDVYYTPSVASYFSVEKRLEYSVTYNANGGTNAPAAQTKTHGVNLTLSTAYPTRTGYVFQGWSTSAGGSVVYGAGANYTANANATLYAVWHPGNYYLSLNGMLDGASAGDLGAYGTVDIYVGGVKVADDVNDYYVQHPYGSAYSIEDIKPAAGKVYEGVSSGSVNGTIQAGNTGIVLAFRTSYYINYNANGGTGAPEAQYKLYGKALTLSNTVPTRDGYTFKGWSISKTGEVAYQPGGSYTDNISTTLYAIWEANYIKPESIVLGAHKTSMTVGETDTVTCSVLPTNAEWESMYFLYYDEDIIDMAWVANENAFIVTAKAVGSTDIIIEVLDEHENTARAQYTLEVTKVIDENAPQFVVEEKTSRAGSTVDVTVSVKNNPGIIFAKFIVTYDDALTLVEVTDSGILGNSTHPKTKTTPYTLYWNNGTAESDFTSNGTAVTLTFEIDSEAADGFYPITIEEVASDTFNYDDDTVYFESVNGGINIVSKIIGDVNGDGEVTARDERDLSRHIASWPGYEDIDTYTADVNADGEVTARDERDLSRHIASWPGYETLPHVK